MYIFEVVDGKACPFSPSPILQKSLSLSRKLLFKAPSMLKEGCKAKKYSVGYPIFKSDKQYHT